MGNRYHLLVETPRGNLVAGMQWLLGVYANRFNHGHRVGARRRAEGAGEYALAGWYLESEEYRQELLAQVSEQATDPAMTPLRPVAEARVRSPREVGPPSFPAGSRGAAGSRRAQHSSW